MSDFEKMLAKGRNHEQALISWLDSNGVPYLATGQEYRPGSEQARSMMRSSFDKISSRVRFFPDLIVYSPSGSVFIEAKCSSGIERRAFLNYREIEREYNELVLIFRRDGRLTPLQGLKFRTPRNPDPISGVTVPILEDCWAMYEQLPSSDRQRHISAYRREGRFTSGMNYALIDFNRSESYPIEVLLSRSRIRAKPEQCSLFGERLAV